MPHVKRLGSSSHGVPRGSQRDGHNSMSHLRRHLHEWQSSRLHRSRSSMEAPREAHRHSLECAEDSCPGLKRTGYVLYLQNGVCPYVSDTSQKAAVRRLPLPGYHSCCTYIALFRATTLESCSLHPFPFLLFPTTVLSTYCNDLRFY